MYIVTDHDEIDLAYPLPPDVVAALAAVIRDEREQEDEEWAAFLAREKVGSGGVESEGVESEGVESGGVEESTHPLPHSPTPPLTTRVCERCGAAFVPTKDNQKYCSPECAHRAELARYACRDLKSEEAWRTAKRERKRERERMRARLAERDAAYEREFGSAAQTGAVRGRVAGGSFRGFPRVSSQSYYC